MRDWRTTTAGVVAAAAYFVATYSADLHLAPLWVDMARFVVAGGLAGMGVMAKDSTR
jgi:hypothetical protein